MEEFQAFGKIPRLSRPIVITEKIDGTNAQVYITPVPEGEYPTPVALVPLGDALYNIYAGSRSRWIWPGKQDNYGFAAWVRANAEELVKLGPGRHYGEWWGAGINRGYGLKNGEKYFSLFNVSKWSDDLVRPECCRVVPVITRADELDTEFVEEALHYLRLEGSLAAPGFMNPEGIVIFHTHGNLLFKKTLKNDEAKGEQK